MTDAAEKLLRECSATLMMAHRAFTHNDCIDWDELLALHNRITAHLSSAPSAGGPVAWMHYDKDGAHFPSLYDWNNPRIGYTVRPMYFRGDMPAILCRHPGDAHQSPSPESRGEVVVPREVHAATIKAYEECAKVCEESQTNGPSSENFMALKCASAIRSHPEYHAALAAPPMTAASGMDAGDE